MRLSKELVAASSTPVLLAILSEGESYGYAILQRVREVSGGEVEWTEGMLYPVLHRLEERGFIHARWAKAESGRSRKYYTLARAGRKLLAEQRRQWNVVHSTLTRIWGAQGA